MAKPEWGTKRYCPSCDTRFYDLMRTPVTCPKCHAPVETDLPLRGRRGTPIAALADPKKAAILETDLDIDIDIEAAVLTDDDALVDVVEDDDTLMEDTSDLGEDNDDMAEVTGHLDDKRDEV